MGKSTQIRLDRPFSTKSVKQDFVRRPRSPLMKGEHFSSWDDIKYTSGALALLVTTVACAVVLVYSLWGILA